MGDHGLDLRGESLDGMTPRASWGEGFGGKPGLLFCKEPDLRLASDSPGSGPISRSSRDAAAPILAPRPHWDKANTGEGISQTRQTVTNAQTQNLGDDKHPYMCP